MLSMISSISDPLGFATLFMLDGRRILQGLFNQDIQWEIEISGAVKKDQKNQVTKLKHIKKLLVRRCMKPDNFGKVVNVSLHHFSDASKVSCGQCSYIRMVNEIGRIQCNLSLGKSRLVPSKFISIPRLELNAAVLSVKICLLKKELKIGEIKEWFWTDNKVVIGYIKNDAQRFKTLLLREYNKLEVTLMCSIVLCSSERKAC